MTTEKTLELNLCHQIVSDLDRLGYSSLMIGLDQLQEARLGFDDGFLTSDFVGFIQVKKGIRRRHHISFHLNKNSKRNQHDKLLSVAGNHRRLCFYALPGACSTAELVVLGAGLLDSTVFYDVLDVPIRRGDRRAHTAQLRPSGELKILSKPVTANSPISWNELIGTSTDKKESSGSSHEGSSAMPPFGIPLEEAFRLLKDLDLSRNDKAAIRGLLISPMQKAR